MNNTFDNPYPIQRRLLAEQKTYSELVQEVRAKMAGDMLENTDATISEIARPSTF